MLGGRPATAVQMTESGRMRIYEGSPRENWAQVLRSIGAYLDREFYKEVLLLEVEDRLLLQVLALPPGGAWSETAQLHKKTEALDDEAIGRLMEEADQRRDTAAASQPHLGISNYYEQALRVLGNYLDIQKPRDLFLFEQEGSFVLRMLAANPTGASAHQLAEFTREEILAMIAEEGRTERDKTPEKSGA